MLMCVCQQRLAGPLETLSIQCDSQSEVALRDSVRPSGVTLRGHEGGIALWSRLATMLISENLTLQGQFIEGLVDRRSDTIEAGEYR